MMARHVLFSHSLDWPDDCDSWSHCLNAGEPIEDVLDKVIEWHFDPEHVEIVKDWLTERVVSHGALMEFLGDVPAPKN